MDNLYAKVGFHNTLLKLLMKKHDFHDRKDMVLSLVEHLAFYKVQYIIFHSTITDF